MIWPFKRKPSPTLRVSPESAYHPTELLDSIAGDDGAVAFGPGDDVRVMAQSDSIAGTWAVADSKHRALPIDGQKGSVFLRDGLVGQVRAVGDKTVMVKFPDPIGLVHVKRDDLWNSKPAMARPRWATRQALSLRVAQAIAVPEGLPQLLVDWVDFARKIWSKSPKVQSTATLPRAGRYTMTSGAAPTMVVRIPGNAVAWPYGLEAPRSIEVRIYAAGSKDPDAPKNSGMRAYVGYIPNTKSEDMRLCISTHRPFTIDIAEHEAQHLVQVLLQERMEDRPHKRRPGEPDGNSKLETGLTDPREIYPYLSQQVAALTQLAKKNGLDTVSLTPHEVEQFLLSDTHGRYRAYKEAHPELWPRVLARFMRELVRAGHTPAGMGTDSLTIPITERYKRVAMPMPTEADLPASWYVKQTTGVTDDDEPEIMWRLYDPEYRYNGQFVPVAALTIVERRPSVWAVSSSFCGIPGGWGAFLYEKALKFVTDRKGWLGSDITVSNSARNVWTKYMDRNDVEKRNRPKEMFPIDSKDTPAVRMMYRFKQKAYLREEDNDGQSAIVAIRVPELLAKDWPDGRDGHDSSPPHVSVVYLGDMRHIPDARDIVSRIVFETVNALPQFEVELEKDVSFFHKDNGDHVAIKKFDATSAENLTKLHDLVKRNLVAAGIPLGEVFEYTPHATLAYQYAPVWPPEMPSPQGSWIVDAVEVWGFDGPDLVFPLRGGAARTAQVMRTSPRYEPTQAYSVPSEDAPPIAFTKPEYTNVKSIYELEYKWSKLNAVRENGPLADRAERALALWTGQLDKALNKELALMQRIFRAWLDARPNDSDDLTLNHVVLRGLRIHMMHAGVPDEQAEKIIASKPRTVQDVLVQLPPGTVRAQVQTSYERQIASNNIRRATWKSVESMLRLIDDAQSLPTNEKIVVFHRALTTAHNNGRMPEHLYGIGDGMNDRDRDADRVLTHLSNMKIPPEWDAELKELLSLPRGASLRMTLTAGGMLTLYHYVPDDFDGGVLDPSRFGAGTYTSRDVRASDVPRVFFYLNPGDREQWFTGRRLFSTQVPSSSIFDIDNGDPKVLDASRTSSGRIDPHELFLNAKGAGYKGIKYDAGGVPLVAYFEPIAVEPVQQEKVAQQQQFGTQPPPLGQSPQPFPQAQQQAQQQPQAEQKPADTGQSSVGLQPLTDPSQKVNNPLMDVGLDSGGQVRVAPPGSGLVTQQVGTINNTDQQLSLNMPATTPAAQQVTDALSGADVGDYKVLIDNAQSGMDVQQLAKSSAKGKKSNKAYLDHDINPITGELEWVLRSPHGVDVRWFGHMKPTPETVEAARRGGIVDRVFESDAETDTDLVGKDEMAQVLFGPMDYESPDDREVAAIEFAQADITPGSQKLLRSKDTWPQRTTYHNDSKVMRQTLDHHDLVSGGVGYSNIMAVMSEATPQETESYGAWYGLGHDQALMISEESGVPLDRVCAVIALLSPGMKWENNLQAARRMCLGEPLAGSGGAFPMNVLKALRVLRGSSIEKTIEASEKVRPFYETLLNPEKSAEKAVVDRHMFAIWFGDPSVKMVDDPSVRALIQRDVQLAAREWNLPVQAIQAITWAIWRQRIKEPRPEDEPHPNEPDAPPSDYDYDLMKQGELQLTAGRYEDVLARYPDRKNLIDFFVNNDPTNWNGPHAANVYLAWMMEQALKNPNAATADVQSIVETVNWFHRRKEALKPSPQNAHPRDINSWKSVDDLHAALTALGKSRSQKKVEGSKIVGQADGWTFYRVLDQAAACLLAKGTTWCIGADKNNMYDYYEGQGDTYIAIKGNEKWAIHTQRGTMQAERVTSPRNTEPPYGEWGSMWPAAEKAGFSVPMIEFTLDGYSWPDNRKPTWRVYIDNPDAFSDQVWELTADVDDPFYLDIVHAEFRVVNINNVPAMLAFLGLCTDSGVKQLGVPGQRRSGICVDLTGPVSDLWDLATKVTVNRELQNYSVEAVDDDDDDGAEVPRTASRRIAMPGVSLTAERLPSKSRLWAMLTESLPERAVSKDMAIHDGAYARWQQPYAKYRSTRPVFTGGELDSLNDALDLKGDARVSGPREAFDRLTRNARTWDDIARVVKLFNAVPGFESMHIPEHVMMRDLDEQERDWYAQEEAKAEAAAQDDKPLSDEERAQLPDDAFDFDPESLSHVAHHTRTAASFLYHVTYPANLPSIGETGLIPGSGATFAQFQWYADGKLFLTTSRGVRGWVNQLNRRSRDVGDIESTPVVCRVRMGLARTRQPDEVGNDDVGGNGVNWAVDHHIAPKDVEVWTTDGWTPVSTFVGASKDTIEEVLTGDTFGAFEKTPRRTAGLPARLYHGTTEASAKGIIEAGGFNGSAGGRQRTSPLEGRTYITADLSLALIHALGANAVGQDVSTWPGRDWTTRGAVVVVEHQPGALIPDEDWLGSAVYYEWHVRTNKKYSPGTYYDSELKAAYDAGKRWIQRIQWAGTAATAAAISRLTNAVDPYPAIMSRSGKTIINTLLKTENGRAFLEAEAVNSPHHAALPDRIAPVEVWTFDKLRDNPKLDSSGSNFFDVAERIWTRDQAEPLSRTAVRAGDLGIKDLRRWTENNDTWAMLSASQQGSLHQRKLQHRKLLRQLQELGVKPSMIVPVRGRWYENGQERAEQSLWVKGLDFDQAVKLGKQFDQDAVIFKSDGGVVGMYDLRNGRVRVPAQSGDLVFGDEAIDVAQRGPKVPMPGKGYVPSPEDLYTRGKSTSMSVRYDWDDAKSEFVHDLKRPLSRADVERLYRKREGAVRVAMPQVPAEFAQRLRMTLTPDLAGQALVAQTSHEEVDAHVEQTNKIHRGTPRDAYGGMGDLRQYAWRGPELIRADDPRLPEVHPASKRDVKQYAKNWSPFVPAVVLAEQGDKLVVLDGAHRIAAARTQPDGTLMAYIGTPKPRTAQHNVNGEPLDAFVGRVRKVLTPDLLKPEWRKRHAPTIDAEGKESRCDPMTGHCYAAAEAAYHALGGAEAGWKPMHIKHEDAPHWYLQHADGTIFDPTASQFQEPPDYAQGRGKGFLTKAPSARARKILERMQPKTAQVDENLIEAVVKTVHGQGTVMTSSKSTGETLYTVEMDDGSFLKMPRREITKILSVPASRAPVIPSSLRPPPAVKTSPQAAIETSQTFKVKEFDVSIEASEVKRILRISSAGWQTEDGRSVVLDAFRTILRKNNATDYKGIIDVETGFLLEAPIDELQQALQTTSWTLGLPRTASGVEFALTRTAGDGGAHAISYVSDKLTASGFLETGRVVWDVISASQYDEAGTRQALTTIAGAHQVVPSYLDAAILSYAAQGDWVDPEVIDTSDATAWANIINQFTQGKVTKPRTPEDRIALKAVAMFTGLSVATVRDPNKYDPSTAKNVERVNLTLGRKFVPTARDYAQAHKVLKAMAQAPYAAPGPTSKTLFRGLRLLEVPMPGDIIDAGAVASFSVDRNMALEYSKDSVAIKPPPDDHKRKACLLVIPNATRGVYVGSTSAYPIEEEVISGGKYRVFTTKNSHTQGVRNGVMTMDIPLTEIYLEPVDDNEGGTVKTSQLQMPQTPQLSREQQLQQEISTAFDQPLNPVRDVQPQQSKIAMPMPRQLPAGWRLKAPPTLAGDYYIMTPENIPAAWLRLVKPRYSPTEAYVARVENNYADTVPGLGAFLYQHVMDRATREGVWLRSDTQVSDKARGVWKKFHDREDVVKEPRDNLPGDPSSIWKFDPKNLDADEDAGTWEPETAPELFHKYKLKIS